MSLSRPLPVDAAQDQIDMITLLNSAVLTSAGDYSYSTISPQQAQELLKGALVQSAIGHASTCAVIERDLGIACPLARIEYTQGVGAIALVFRLNRRPAKPGDLTVEEIDSLGYHWAKLERKA